MNIRTLTVAPLLLLLLGAQVATGQTPGFDRFSLQLGAGPLLKSGGHTVSAAFGFSPISRVDLVVNVERDHLPFQRDTFSDRLSLNRGGTLTSVSGEVRASVFPPHRVSPYGFAGIGGGVSRPTVNDAFPESRRERSACRLFWRRCACSDTQRPQRVRRRAREAGDGRRRNIGRLAGARRRRVAFLNERT